MPNLIKTGGCDQKLKSGDTNRMHGDAININFPLIKKGRWAEKKRCGHPHWRHKP
jgi:hypothetical protein